MHGKLTTIDCYWFRYRHNEKYVILLFGIGTNVVVNSIIGIPTLKLWRSIFHFDLKNLLPNVSIQSFQSSMKKLSTGYLIVLFFNSQILCDLFRERFLVHQSHLIIWTMWHYQVHLHLKLECLYHPYLGLSSKLHMNIFIDKQMCHISND